MKSKKHVAIMDEDHLPLLVTSIIRADAVTWGDQNEDGQKRSIFKIKRNRC
jgi:hypothetical protein